MSWTYGQADGRLVSAKGALLATGYAGKGQYKNDPEAQCESNLGPLPAGEYTIKSPVDTSEHGPFVLWLTPASTNEMFGRESFGIHGDSLQHPGEASEGCIIMPRFARERVWESGDHELQVVKTTASEDSAWPNG